MADQRDPEKREILTWVKEELYTKFKKLSEQRGQDMSKIIRDHIEEITSEIQLSPEDYAIIASEVAERARKNEQKRKAKSKR